MLLLLKLESAHLLPNTMEWGIVMALQNTTHVLDSCKKK